MNDRDYFTVGLKLLGVYFLFISLYYISEAIIVLSPSFTSKYPNEYLSIWHITQVATCVVPLLYIAVGMYLISNGRILYDYAYPNAAQSLASSLNSKIILALRLLGVYLVVSELPTLLKSIASYIVYTNTPKYMNIFQEKQASYANLLPSLGGIILGIYILKKNNYIERCALVNNGSIDPDKQDE